MTEPEVRALTITVRNPADQRGVGEVRNERPEAIAVTASELRLFQPEWQAVGAQGRKAWLLKFQDWVLDNAEHIADVVQSESANTRAEALTEPTAVADFLNYWAGNAQRFLADTHPVQRGLMALTKKLTTAYRPYSLVGVITPRNFPFAMPGVDVVPALAAGAAVLLKPSEVTPLSAVEFVHGWTEIDAPPVLALATGCAETGAAVIDVVDYVQFTGSTATGRKVAVRCAQRLIPYSLELGGKDPAIVLADADLERAANGIACGGLTNSGRLCVSVERVYVEEPVYDEFVAKLTSKVAALRQGKDAYGCKHDVGGLATPAQRDIVQRHVDDAVAAGAAVVTGGKSTGTGTFFQPTVLVGVKHSMTCMTEETFGPTLPVMKVVDEAEAIRLANDSAYGLSATVWTADKERGERVARQLEVGAVNINDVLANAYAYAIPMGGWTQSGFGARAGGADGVRKYCRAQAITSPRIPTASKDLPWYPSSSRSVKVALAVMRAGAAHGLRRFGVSPRGALGELPWRRWKLWPRRTTTRT